MSANAFDPFPGPDPYSMDDDDARAKAQAQKTIGPFYFDIDDYIDTVVLDNQ